MSDTEVTTTETPAVEATTPPARQSRAELRAQLTAKTAAAVDSVFAKAREAVAAKPEPTTETTQPETVQETVAALEEVTGEEAPAQKPNESKTQYETRIAKLLLQVQRAEANGLKHKSDFEKVTAELAEARAIIESAKKGPKEALALAGWDPVKVAQAMADGSLTQEEVKEIKADLPPEVLELIEEGKRLKAEKKSREDEAAALETRKGQVKIVDDAKKAIADKFPVVALADSDQLLSLYLNATKANNGEEPDFESFAADLQKNTIKEIIHYAGDVNTLKVILAEKPELKDVFTQALGLKAAAPVVATLAATETRTLTNSVSAENPSKGRQLTSQERMQLAKAAAEKMFQRG